MYFTVIITKQIDFYDKAICRLWYKYPTIWINYTIVCNAESVTLPIRQTDPPNLLRTNRLLVIRGVGLLVNVFFFRSEYKFY